MEENKKKVIIDLMKIIINHEGDLTKTNIANESALSFAYKMEDKKYYELILKCSKSVELLSNKSGRDLLTKIIKDKNNNHLSQTLDKCLIEISHTEFLLDLALDALKKNSMDIYEVILKHCKERNTFLDNGEIFLTNILKNNEDIDVIKKIIESKQFDVNAVNRQGETPLMVACEKLNITIVKLLLQFGSDVTYKNYGAVQATMNAKSQNSSKEIDSISNDIMNELWKSPKSQEVNTINQQNRIGRGLTRNVNSINYYDQGYYYGYGNQPMAYAQTNKNLIGATVTSLEQQVLNLMELLINVNGNVVTENANLQSAISSAYNLSDKCFFLAMLENNSRKLRIFSTKSGVQLLFTMANQKKWSMLSNILNKSEINENSNDKLLNLALKVLKDEEINVFNEIINRCVDVNAILDEGETLITNLFKHNIKEQIIKIVIKSEIFDSKKPNQNKESALMLACSRLMADIVPLLLRQGCDVTYSGFNAVKLTILADHSQNTVESEEKKISILSLFFEKNNCKCSIKNDIIQSNIISRISQKSQYVIPRNMSVERNFYIENISKFNFIEAIIVSLFGKSDNLDFLISLHDENKGKSKKSKSCDKIKKSVREIITWKIVYPLREFGFVSQHRIYEISNLIKDVDFLEIEDCLVFLSKISNGTNLLNFITYNLEESDSMMWKLFIDLKISYDYISFQDLFNISMIQNQTLFKKAPECLIVQAIRDPNSLFSYKNIIPSKTIEISNLTLNSFKKCFHCVEKATWQCFICISERVFSFNHGFFCESHKCTHSECVILPQSKSLSNSKIYMKLSAIIYKLNNKYSALIRQKNFQHLWFSFKAAESGNQNLSKLSYDEEISGLLVLNENDIKNVLMRSNMEYFQKIIGNSHYFVYENNSLNCY